jgi:uncharacterized protein
MKQHNFDKAHVIHELRHYLPSQTPLKDFIHHNSLHAFQEMAFYDAIFNASDIFGFQVTLPLVDFRALYDNGRIRKEIVDRTITKSKGKENIATWKNKMLTGVYDIPNVARIGHLRSQWKDTYKIDLDNLVQPLLFRVLCGYLDQGVSIWHFPFTDEGLLKAIQTMESSSFVSFFKTKRAKQLLNSTDLSLEKLLSIVVGKESYFEQYLFDQQFSHRGWSGMVASIEDNPASILYKKQIHLEDLLILELLMEIDALDNVLGESKWKPISSLTLNPPADLFASTPKTELSEVLTLWQDAFEWSYYDEVLSGLNQAQLGSVVAKLSPSFQAVFCIDEREDSLRRHIESVDDECETYGCPGFFGVEFYFQPMHGKFYEKLCPAPVTPKYLIKEYDVEGHREHDILYSKKAHSFRGFFVTLSLGLFAAFKMFLSIFRPKMSPAISDAFAHMNIDGKLLIENKNINDIENGLQLGFTIDEMTTRVENLLRGIGMIKDFSPLVYIVAHGSSSANNPHHGAHDCGACSGRPGSVNSRVFAHMANHAEVRKNLASKGIVVEPSTRFVAALHDTASDEMAFYDEAEIEGINVQLHAQNKEKFENALNFNAKERSRRFASINTNQDIHKVRDAIRRRSVSMFEPRPELGHGTNALCFIGKRQMTKNLFLDRRAFMNSYDYKTDPEGKLLLGVMRPIPPVCGGINLEYYFSRVDNYKMGAGTKLPHNVMGLIGVANSSDGDLRPGLPLQMIEVHDPVRLMVLVEHHPDVILNTIKQETSLYDWFLKGWVHLVAIDPATNNFYYFSDGTFTEYKPTNANIEKIDNLQNLIEGAKEMTTNHILDATKENLPVKILK